MQFNPRALIDVVQPSEPLPVPGEEPTPPQLTQPVEQVEPTGAPRYTAGSLNRSVLAAPVTLEQPIAEEQEARPEPDLVITVTRDPEPT